MGQIIETPIRSLFECVNYCLENINPQLSKDIEESNKEFGKKIKIKILSSEQFCTPCVTEDRTVCVSECFLCYLWCMCYYACVYYDESIVSVLNGTSNEISEQMVEECKLLKEWGLGITKGYYDWPEDLPRPDVESNDYILPCNELFVFSCTYIFCHELAHLMLGHFDNTNKIQIEKEIEADRQAYTWIVNGRDGQCRNSIMSIIIGTCCLIFLGKHTDKDCKTHPGFVHRLKELCNLMKNDVSNFTELEKPILLTIGSFLWEWNKMFGKDIDFDFIINNPSSIFEYLETLN